MEDGSAVSEITKVLDNRCIDGSQGRSPVLRKVMAYTLQFS